METVLVTGATGTLGRSLVPLLVDAGHHVRGMTRDSGRAARIRQSGATAVVADILAGAGPGAVTLGDAMAGADHVLHLATNPGRGAARLEVDMTTAVLDARDAVAPGAVVTYVSIVGCDRTPTAYYRGKTDAERLVRERARTRVVRATQFHELLAWFVRVVPGARRAVVPAGWVFQPVAAADVAAVLAGALDGELPAEIGGPEVLTFEEVARRRTGLGVVQVPAPGKLSAAIRSGSLLAGPEAVRAATRFPRTGPTG